MTTEIRAVESLIWPLFETFQIVPSTSLYASLSILNQFSQIAISAEFKQKFGKTETKELEELCDHDTAETWRDTKHYQGLTFYYYCVPKFMGQLNKFIQRVIDEGTDDYVILSNYVFTGKEFIRWESGELFEKTIIEALDSSGKGVYYENMNCHFPPLSCHHPFWDDGLGWGRVVKLPKGYKLTKKDLKTVFDSYSFCYMVSLGEFLPDINLKEENKEFVKRMRPNGVPTSNEDNYILSALQLSREKFEEHYDLVSFVVRGCTGNPCGYDFVSHEIEFAKILHNITYSKIVKRATERMRLKVINV